MNDFVELLFFKSLFLFFSLANFSTDFSIVSIQLICVHLIKLGLRCSQRVYGNVCLCFFLCYFSSIILFSVDFVCVEKLSGPRCMFFLCFAKDSIEFEWIFACQSSHAFFLQIQTHHIACIFSENICAVD